MKYALPLLIAIILSALAGVLLINQSTAQDVVVPNLPSLLQDITTNQNTYEIGAPVDIIFAVKNRSQQPLTYRFASGKQFDVWVMRGPREVWRHSRNTAYTQASTAFTLQPGEIKSWTVRWNQTTNEGEAAAPCGYDVYAQLMPMTQTLQPVKTSITLGECTGIAILPISIDEGIRRFTTLRNQRVSINATYQGSRPDPGAKNCHQGPPVSRSDWAMSDDTGCMYVTGGTLGLDPTEDVGRLVSVVGNLRRTDRGQVYLEFVSGTLRQQ